MYLGHQRGFEFCLSLALSLFFSVNIPWNALCNRKVLSQTHQSSANQQVCWHCHCAFEIWLFPARKTTTSGWKLRCACSDKKVPWKMQNWYRSWLKWVVVSFCGAFSFLILCFASDRMKLWTVAQLSDIIYMQMEGPVFLLCRADRYILCVQRSLSRTHMCLYEDATAYDKIIHIYDTALPGRPPLEFVVSSTLPV